MAAGLGRALPDWRPRLEAVLGAEEALYARFLAAVEGVRLRGARGPMAQFRSLSAEATSAASWPRSAIAGYRAHQPIAVGTINTNVRVETAAGPLFLRINEGKSRGRRAARGGHRRARRRRAACRRRCRAPHAAGAPFARWRDEFVSLFPWVPGRTLARAELTPAHAAAVGAALARAAPRQRRLRRPPRPAATSPRRSTRGWRASRRSRRPELAPARRRS